MESTINTGRKSPIFLGLALFTCVLTFSATLANTEQTTEETSVAENAEKPHFTLMDTEETISRYRSERYKKIAEGLASSSLSDDHRELLATAMSKMYLGVPVSSFTHMEREESSDLEEPSESNANLFVSDDGRIQHASESIVRGLNSPSPFISLPLLPFIPATGRILNESDTEANFIFDVETNMIAEAGDDDSSGMMEKMKMVAELTVGKLDQSPTRFILRLEKPLRKRFLFKLSKFQMELHYSYIDSCSGYAVNQMSMEVNASVIIKGKMHELMESTFTDIECAQPLRYLLPNEDESNFFQF
ncbi:MAG: hypothetical protein OXH84_01595 [Gammaproteobacteria bacterium]|nr:hypothetical protein [Gammaproteobacteria bacterium]